MSDAQLAETMEDMGYAACGDVEFLKELMQCVGEVNEDVVAEVLCMMMRTHTGLTGARPAPCGICDALFRRWCAARGASGGHVCVLRLRHCVHLRRGGNNLLPSDVKYKPHAHSADRRESHWQIRWPRLFSWGKAREASAACSVLSTGQ